MIRLPSPLLPVLILLLSILCVPIHLAHGADQFIVFIHTGSVPPNNMLVKQIAGTLVANGFLVRAPDDDKNLEYGPGVEYFDDSARAKAEEVAKAVNEVFAKADLAKLGISKDRVGKITARKLNIKSNPPSYLGLWLFCGGEGPSCGPPR